MSKEGTPEIRLINLSTYVAPKIVENKHKNWVTYGRNNSFYQYIIDRKNGSPTNSSIINSYTDLIYGKGLATTSSKVSDMLLLKKILSPKTVEKIVSDFQLFKQASMQVIETKGKDLSSIEHLPQNFVAPSIVDNKGIIPSYWVSADWSKQFENTPKEFTAFGYKKSKLSIYSIQPYEAGQVYFSNPDYLSGIQYAEVEEEISNLYINSIKNGLSAGYMINYADGNILTEEQKNKFERKIRQRLTGSTNASNFIINFMGRDVEITVVPFPVNANVHKQWEFLTKEAKQQLLTAHRATSPSIVGIISSSGFSNTADEMDMAEEQLMKRVIQPKQEIIINALEEILVQYGINLSLFFKPLTEPKEDPVTELSHVHSAQDLIDLGEDEDLENYDIVDEIEVDYNEVITFASTGTARPNSKSEQDSDDILIRYRYVGNKTPEREFCQKMISAEKIYRKEDIIQLENKAVNPGWGPNGADTYSIWLWKGGGNCHHKWNRVIYLKKGVKIDVNSPLAETISTSKARREGKKVPVNDSLVSIAPINMPNQGFLEKLREQIKLAFNPNQKRDSKGRWVSEGYLGNIITASSKQQRERAKIEWTEESDKLDKDEDEGILDDEDFTFAKSRLLHDKLQDYFGGKYTDIGNLEVRIADHPQTNTRGFADLSFVVTNNIGAGKTYKSGASDIGISYLSDFSDALDEIEKQIKNH